jgi:hypothetical protein
MNDWRNERRSRHDVITIPVLWLAFVLSLLVHIAALWHLLPNLRLLATDAVSPGDEVAAPLTAQLQGPSTLVPESRPPVVVAEPTLRRRRTRAVSPYFTQRGRCVPAAAA